MQTPSESMGLGNGHLQLTLQNITERENRLYITLMDRHTPATHTHVCVYISNMNLIWSRNPLPIPRKHRDGRIR